jgi:hypothetical protein
MFLISLLLSLPLTSSPYQEGLGVINHLRYQFETNYAPKSLKEKAFGWNLREETKKLKSALKSEDFQTWRKALKGFFDSTRDIHVHVSFQSSGFSTLPFQLAESEGRYFVVYVDKESCPDCPLQIGDEILGWNGEAIDEVTHHFFEKEFGRLPFSRSWFELVVRYLTVRDGEMGVELQTGDVEIDFIRQEDLGHATLKWNVSPEFYPQKMVPKSLVAEKRSPLLELASIESSLSPIYTRFDTKQKKKNLFAMASKISFLPPLGPILWQSWEKDPYHAYLFETPQGAKVGYLRIPHFRFDKESDFFCLTRLVRKLNEMDASLLVIDLFHNPGGLAFNMYASVSLFIDQPVKALSQWEVISSLQIQMAMRVKEMLTSPDLFEEEKEQRKSFFGYPADERLEKSFSSYADFVLDQAAKGSKISEAYPFLGIEEILPHPKTHFSKPILILTDPLDFSCADFFPAILKDAGRATLFGAKTAGAGGALSPPLSFPNRYGISSCRMTTSVLTRPNGKIVEGIGIEPDIMYHLTPQDFLENFEPVRQEIVGVVEEMLGLRAKSE